MRIEVKTRRVFALLLLSLTATSCWVYTPQLADIPLIEHKGDMRLNGSVYMNPVRRGYFFSPALGLSASFSAGLTDWMAINTYVGYQLDDNFYTHVALGGYKSFGVSVLEGYLGAGFGHSENYIDNIPASSSIYYLCPFMQVNYGLHITKYVDIGVSMKAGAYSPLRVDAHIPDDASPLPSVPSFSPLLEPQVFFRFGEEKYKVQVQAGYVRLFGWPDKYLLTYHPISIGFGVTWKL